MVHLRIVVPPDLADKVLALLYGTPAVINVVRLRDAAQNPDGDLIQCDVARETPASRRAEGERLPHRRWPVDQIVVRSQ